MAQPAKKAILVIGGGISGVSVAVEAAEAGYNVILVEKNPYLGGRVAQHYRYFPKLCPPYCGLEINFRRIKQNPNISFYTLSEVTEISGSAGDFNVKIRQFPRYVNSKCTCCSRCVDVCPETRVNEFNFGMDTTKAIYLPHEMAFPMKYAIDDRYCKGAECGKCVEVCKYDAIELDAKETSFTLNNIGSIVFATGWNLYDMKKVDNLGFGRVKNVITNMMMERLAAPNGPTDGKIERPSDGKEVKKVAFVQCAGSRDENHLNYCSAICCMSSLKESTYIREKNPDSQVSIFYIDLRTPGKYEDFLKKVEKDEKIKMIKGKVAKIEQASASDDVIVTFEDVINMRKMEERFDMVVLAAGMEAQTKMKSLPGKLQLEANGFIFPTQAEGIYSAGVAKKPGDVTSSVQDATASALRAIQTAFRK